MKLLSIGIEKSEPFGCCDLDLDLMTLIYELDPKILKTYLRTKRELPTLRLSEVREHYRGNYKTKRYHAAFACGKC